MVVHRPHDEEAGRRGNWLAKARKRNALSCGTLAVEESRSAVAFIVCRAEQLEGEVCPIRVNAKPPKPYVIIEEHAFLKVQAKGEAVFGIRLLAFVIDEVPLEVWLVRPHLVQSVDVSAVERPNESLYDLRRLAS